MNTVNSSQATMLLSAAFHGNLGEVRCLVLEGTDVNARDHDGYTALTHAAKQGHLDIVTYLLGEGALMDPHGDYSHHDSPLLAAVRGGHLAIVKKLIERGANPHRHVGGLLEMVDFYAAASGEKLILEYLKRITDLKTEQPHQARR